MSLTVLIMAGVGAVLVLLLILVLSMGRRPESRGDRGRSDDGGVGAHAGYVGGDDSPTGTARRGLRSSDDVDGADSAGGGGGFDGGGGGDGGGGNGGGD